MYRFEVNTPHGNLTAGVRNLLVKHLFMWQATREFGRNPCIWIKLRYRSTEDPAGSNGVDLAITHMGAACKRFSIFMAEHGTEHFAISPMPWLTVDPSERKLHFMWNCGTKRIVLLHAFFPFSFLSCPPFISFPANSCPFLHTIIPKADHGCSERTQNPTAILCQGKDLTIVCATLSID